MVRLMFCLLLLATISRGMATLFAQHLSRLLGLAASDPGHGGRFAMHSQLFFLVHEHILVVVQAGEVGKRGQQSVCLELTQLALRTSKNCDGLNPAASQLLKQTKGIELGTKLFHVPRQQRPK